MNMAEMPCIRGQCEADCQDVLQEMPFLSGLKPSYLKHYRQSIVKMYWEQSPFIKRFFCISRDFEGIYKEDKFNIASKCSFAMKRPLQKVAVADNREDIANVKDREAKVEQGPYSYEKLFHE